MKLSYRSTLISILFFLISMPSWSSTLEEIISLSWEKDDFIKAQQMRVSASDLDKWARFIPNNPTINYSNTDNSSWQIFGGNIEFDFPGKAFAMRKVDNTLYENELTELKAKKNEIAQFVLSRYVDCSSGKQLLGILGEATSELETLSKTLTARYELGQSTQAERIGMELQYRQAKIEYEAIRDKSAVACKKYNELLFQYELKKLEPDEHLNLPDDLSPAVVSQMSTKSIDVIRAENDVRLSRVRISTAVWENLPHLTLGYYRQYYNSVQASPIIPIQWTSTYTVSIILPIFYPFFNGNDVSKMRADNMIVERRSEMKKMEAEQAMMNARNDFQRNKLILTKLRNHDLPMSETMVDSTLAAYKVGKLGFSELILAKRTWLDLKKEEVNLKLSLLNSRLLCLSNCDGESL